MAKAASIPRSAMSLPQTRFTPPNLLSTTVVLGARGSESVKAIFANPTSLLATGFYGTTALHNGGTTQHIVLHKLVAPGVELPYWRRPIRYCREPGAALLPLMGGCYGKEQGSRFWFVAGAVGSTLIASV